LRNLTLLTDLYELTMMQGYYLAGIGEKPAVFDLFFRSAPFAGGYTVAAGLEQAISYLVNLKFDAGDLSYLDSLGLFRPDFLHYLETLRFRGNVDAIPEGTVVFPHEPLMRVEAGLMEGQLIESTLLNLINFQTLVATKAARIVQAAAPDPVVEFGLRRAQGPDAAVLGARAAFIGGAVATSNVAAGQLWGIPVRGTQAHSWVQAFADELEAFRAYARAFPSSCLLLVDTYNVLESGMPHALQVASELRDAGYRLAGIRLDSGDLAYLSKRVRVMLDQAGFQDAIILGTGDLDEYLIRDIKAQGSAVSAWGVGTKLITAYDDPALGGVYKLAAKEAGGRLQPEIKISENPAKITNPGVKKVARLYNGHGRAVADLIMLQGEELDPGKPLTIFDPDHTWKRKTLVHFTYRQLLVPVLRSGRLVYQLPALTEVRGHAAADLATFSPEHRRLVNPHRYFVDLSLPLWELKQSLLRQGRPNSD